MKVLQIIDSLEVGGAERIAVTYANVLSSNLESHLCATRHKGLLHDTIDKSVSFLFLNKKRTIDILAILRLHTYINKNKIDVLHAHSSSFFLATIVKLLNRKIKLVWHDHYGDSEHLKKRKHRVLKFCSRFFDTIISVNSKLQEWATNNLHCKRVIYMPNFVSERIDDKYITTLSGIDKKKILCLANFRAQKDHINLLEAYHELVKNHPDCTLHLVGKNFKDDYEASIREFVKEKNLDNNVFIHGSCTDIGNILSQADIGVLSSKSEGLPVALLEYGIMGLPVVVTDVGECSMVIKNEINGLLIPSKNVNALHMALLDLVENPTKSLELGLKLKETIKGQYSEKSVLKKILELYKNI